MKLLEDRVLIRKPEEDNKTAGGIIYTEKIKKEIEEAEVVEVGPGRLLASGKVVPVDVNKGDKVLYDTRSILAEVEIEGEKLYLIKVTNIHMVL
jgi:chaperonin GroES